MKNTFIFFLIGILIIGLFSLPQTYLTLSNQLTGERYLLQPVRKKEEFSLTWRHSVELQPWEEIFQANPKDKEFVLVETRFRSYGAGVPDLSLGGYRLEDGFIVYKNLYQTYSSLPFYLSHFALYHLKIRNKSYDLSLIVPDNTKVALSLEELSWGSYLGSSIKSYFKKIFNIKKPG